PRAEVHGHREQPERHHEVHAGPLDAAGQAEQHADTDPPPAVAETWAVRVVDPTAGYRFGQAFADLFAVHHHTAEGRHHEHGEEDVQHPHPGLDVQHAVGDHQDARDGAQDRKSTRLNSSHVKISYAVFCLKKKNKKK